MLALIENCRTRVNILVENSNCFLDGIEILGEEILYQKGCFVKIRRWLRGDHPKLGILSPGLTGMETIIEQDIIKPIFTCQVLDSELVSEASLNQLQS